MRDVLTYVHGAHSVRSGYEGWNGDDIALFAAAYSQPTFQSNSLIDLINDNPFSEGGLPYCTITPATGTTPDSSSCTGVQTRLNTSFVRINYAYNAAVANYNCLIASAGGASLVVGS